MIVNEYGQVDFETKEIIEKLYSQEWQTVTGFMASVDEMAKWNEHCMHFELSPVTANQKPQQDPQSYHDQKSFQWKMPIEFLKFDPVEFFSKELVNRSLNSQDYLDYLVNEIQAWDKIMSPESAINLWKFLHYLITTCKEHDIVTGVGRGSSVSSLVLFLLGVHAVDPVKYKLNYNEFLR